MESFNFWKNYIQKLKKKKRLKKSDYSCRRLEQVRKLSLVSGSVRISVVAVVSFLCGYWMMHATCSVLPHALLWFMHYMGVVRKQITAILKTRSSRAGKVCVNAFPYDNKKGVSTQPGRRHHAYWILVTITLFGLC